MSFPRMDGHGETNPHDTQAPFCARVSEVSEAIGGWAVSRSLTVNTNSTTEQGYPNLVTLTEHDVHDKKRSERSSYRTPRRKGAALNRKAQQDRR